MSQRINARSFDGNNNINIQIDFPDMCPICNHGIVPIYVSSIYETNNGITYLQLNFLCSRRDCYNMFISYYKKYDGGNASFIESKPKNFSGKNFGGDILMLKDKIPTKFFEIYNEAEQAEQLGLFTICGGGYRKALEFLIKDYAIHLNESERDKIEGPKYTLSQCIKDYMPSKTTKTFSTLSTRLGNDEVHYTKQHDKDIRYMKTTISALLSTIHNVCRYLTFSVAIAEENVAKPLQISAVVCLEGAERSGEVIFFLVIFSREIFHSIFENLIFSVSIFFKRGRGGIEKIETPYLKIFFLGYSK